MPLSATVVEHVIEDGKLERRVRHALDVVLDEEVDVHLG
jgi:hypothetical protein